MLPNIDILEIVKVGFQFLKGIVTDIQLRNLMLIATATILQGKFNLSHASRTWLNERSANAFSHCLKRAKINIKEAIQALAKMQQQSYTLTAGRFIIDDTLEHHTRFCKFIHAVCCHWDHVFHTNTKGICIVFLYYSQGNWIKFPIGWRIYLKKEKTKNDLAIELIKEALKNGFPCNVVLCDSWFCVRPFISVLQDLGLSYILEIKTNANIRVPNKELQMKKRGRKRKKWYKTVNIKTFMKLGRKSREIGFKGDINRGKPDKILYTIKERTGIINALPGKHKVIYSCDNKRKTEKYLITNELTWEGVKVVKEYFFRWVIEEFFRNAKQQLNLEGACIRSEQGVAIKLLLVSCIDSLIHIKIAKLVSKDPKSGALTFQSIIRLAILENAKNFVTLIKSPDGERFLYRWLNQLKKDAIRKRKMKSEVDYLDQKLDEGIQDVA